jgi:hypothetical protein
MLKRIIASNNLTSSIHASMQRKEMEKEKQFCCMSYKGVSKKVPQFLMKLRSDKEKGSAECIPLENTNRSFISSRRRKTTLQGTNSENCLRFRHKTDFIIER